MSGDAFHMTQPSEGGEGPAQCMDSALADAGLNHEDVDYINAHGTSTPAGDVAETLAIKRSFGDKASKLAVSSTKSMTGHLLGAAGGVEALFTILALRDRVAPPTINLENPDPECDLDYVPNTAREMGVTDSFNPTQNIHAGVRYFKKLLRRFKGNVRLALAAYNAGSENVREYNGIPPFKATHSYIKKVLYYQRYYKKQPAGNAILTAGIIRS